MRDKDLYATILGVASPCLVRDVKPRSGVAGLAVFIEHDGTQALPCPHLVGARIGLSDRGRFSPAA